MSGPENQRISLNRVLLKSSVQTILLAIGVTVWWLIEEIAVSFIYNIFFILFFALIFDRFYKLDKRIVHIFVGVYLLTAALEVILVENNIVQMTLAIGVSCICIAALNTWIIFRDLQMQMSVLEKKHRWGVQILCCLGFSVGVLFPFYLGVINSVETTSPIALLITMATTSFFAVYLLHLQKPYLKSYRYNWVNIHTAGGKYFEKIRVEDVEKRGEFYIIKMEQGTREIRISEGNVDYFEYFTRSQ